MRAARQLLPYGLFVLQSKILQNSIFVVRRFGGGSYGGENSVADAGSLFCVQRRLRRLSCFHLGVISPSRRIDVRKPDVGCVLDRKRRACYTATMPLGCLVDACCVVTDFCDVSNSVVACKRSGHSFDRYVCGRVRGCVRGCTNESLQSQHSIMHSLTLIILNSNVFSGHPVTLTKSLRVTSRLGGRLSGGGVGATLYSHPFRPCL